MATITATGASSIVQPKFVHAGMYSMTGRFNFASVSVGDVIQMVKVPAGFQVHEIVADMMISAVSVIAAVVNIGDGDSTNRYIVSATVSQVPTFTRLGGGSSANLAVLPYTYSVGDTIDVVCSTVSGSGTNNSPSITIGLIVMGSVDFQA